MSNKSKPKISIENIICIVIGIAFFIFWRYLINESQSGGHDNYFNLFCYLIIGLFPSIYFFAIGLGLINYDENYSRSNSETSSYNYTKKNKKRTTSEGIIAPGKTGQYIDKSTGEFKTKDFFGFKTDTKDSIDLENGQYMTRDFFGCKIEAEKKIDLETGEISEKGFWGYHKTGIKVDQTTGIIKEKNFLGDWKESGERINPETGKKQKKTFWGDWKDIY